MMIVVERKKFEIGWVVVDGSRYLVVYKKGRKREYKGVLTVEGSVGLAGVLYQLRRKVDGGESVFGRPERGRWEGRDAIVEVLVEENGYGSYVRVTIESVKGFGRKAVFAWCAERRWLE